MQPDGTDMQAYYAVWDELTALYSMWNDPSNNDPGMRKMIVEEYLAGIRKINEIKNYPNNDVYDFERVHGALEGSEKYLRSPASGILGTVREKLGDAARVAGEATAVLRGGLASGMALPALAAALVGLGIGKVVAENLAADALKAQNPATLRVRPGSANEPAYSLALQETAMGLLPASVTNALPGVPAGFATRKAPPPAGLAIDTSGLLPPEVPAPPVEEPPEVPPPPSDNQLSAYNLPTGVPGGNLATKIVNVSYTAMPGSDMPIVKLNYADGSSRAVPTSDPELRAYEDSLPNRGPGIIGSVTSALSSMASAVAGAFTPGRSTTVIVTPDGKVQPAAQPAAAPAPKNPLVAKALESPGVPPAMSDTDMYGTPAPGATDTQLAGAKAARDATGAGWKAPITPDEQARYRADQEALFVKTMEDRWKAGIDGLSAAGLGEKAAALGLARDALAIRRKSALANLVYLRPSLQLATSQLQGQAPIGAARGSAEYELWMQQQNPQVGTHYLATVKAYGEAQSAYDTATEAYIASTLTPELLLAKPGEWSNITQVDHPSILGVKVLGGLYTDGSGNQSFRYLGWDDNAGALTQAPAPADPAPADPAGGKRGGGGDAPTIIPGSGAGLAGISAAAGATPQAPAPVPPAAPGGAGPRLVTVGARPTAAPAAPAAVRERAYESKDDPTTGFRHTWDDAGNHVRSTPIPGWDVKNTYKHTQRMRDDGAIVDLVTDSQGAVIEERVLTAPDPLKVEAAKEARLTGAAQRVALGNNQLLQQSTLDQGAWAAERTQANEAYDNKRKDLESKIKASSEARKRQVLDLVAQKKLTLPQALSILHDQQGLATAMATEQQKWEQQRAQRMAEKDKGLTYAQSLDKDIGFGNALLSLRSDPQAEDIKRRYAADISTLPGNAGQSVGVRLAQQRGYSGISYEDPGAWQQPNVDVTPEALASMGVGADPTDEFYAAYMALEQPVMKPRPSSPTLMPMPTGAPAAQVAPLPAAVGGWGAGLGRFGR